MYFLDADWQLSTSSMDNTGAEPDLAAEEGPADVETADRKL